MKAPFLYFTEARSEDGWTFITHLFWGYLKSHMSFIRQPGRHLTIGAQVWIGQLSLTFTLWNPKEFRR